jgi:hypothetical protein
MFGLTKRSRENIKAGFFDTCNVTATVNGKPGTANATLR